MTLDIHVIHRDEPHDWLLQCLQSIAPWHYRVYDGTGRTTAANRARAIADSSAEYIAWVDPDDWIDAAQILAMLDALASRPDAAGAFSAETIVDADGNQLQPPDLSDAPWRPLSQITSPRYAHNITILRRRAALPHLAAMQGFSALSEYVLKSLATQSGPLLRIPVPAYYWRQHPAQLHRSTSRDEHARAIRTVSRTLIAHTGGFTRAAATIAATAHPARCLACRGAQKIRRTVVGLAKQPRQYLPIDAHRAMRAPAEG